jgi:hypothetical protein
MKKLLVTFLVLATVFAYAGNGNGNGNGNGHNNGNNNNTTVVTTPTEPTVTDLYEYYKGVFKIKQDGSLSLTYYSPDSKYGQIEEFGYYKVGNPEKKFLLDSHLTGNETVTIKNLKAGDEIAFYMDSKKSGEVMIYSSNVTLPNSTTYFYEKDYGNQDYGYTFGDTKWEKGRALAWKMGTNPAPSGQPLPGALTTMLIAGGCAAFLKRKKAARK